jgi:hypothetical protein
LLGGWHFPYGYQRGAIAIDFSRMKLWMVGHVQVEQTAILEYDLPAMGSGPDPNSWPVVGVSRTISNWWPGAQGYGHGLIFWRGKLWVSPRVFYAQPGDGNVDTPLTLFAQDGETMTFPNLKRQEFSGFVKRGPGLDPLIGGGGAESGQGTIAGPTLATLGGQVLITYGRNAQVTLPGANLENWNRRAPRPPNYRPLRTGTLLTVPVPEDSWIGWIPRVVNGELQGRWAADRIFAGGLALPEGITYWPWMGTGDLDYVRQTYTFANGPDNRTYEYRYSGNGEFQGYYARPDLGLITGHELGPDGSVYLVDEANGWLDSPSSVSLKVFR